MNIKIVVTNWDNIKSDKLSVERYIQISLFKDKDGAVEQAEGNANSAQDAISRLCAILAKKEILSARDITFIAEGHERDATLIQEE